MLRHTPENTSIFLPAQDSLARSSYSKCDVCEAGSRERIWGVDSRPAYNKIIRRITSKSQMLTIRNNDSMPEATTSWTNAVISKIIIPSESPAIISLRKLSLPILPDHVSLPTVARRMSNAMAATFKFGTTQKSPNFRDQSPENGMTTSPTESSQWSPRHKLMDRHSHRQRPSYGDQPEVPASIIVSKASDAYQFNDHTLSTILRASSNHLNEEEGVVQRNPPSVELVAFYSEHRKEASLQHGVPKSNRSMAASTSHEYRKASFAKLSESTKSRRQSAIADLAVTFADVHIAPGTFATNSNPHKNSFGSTESPQRVSAVQFRSRNSVHEIIWREDETTSGSSVSCSSPGSSSPDHNAQFQTIGGLGAEREGSHAEPLQMTASQGLDVPFLNSEQDPNSSHAQETLFHFSWTPPRPISSLDVQEYDKTNPKNRPATLTVIKDQAILKTARRSSLGQDKPGSGRESPHVASFPPLLKRQSSLEWRRAPTVDTDDSCARSLQADLLLTDQMVDSTIPRKGSSADERERRYTRRMSDHPRAPPRLWETGKVGSHIGVSTHQNRLLRRASAFMT